MSNAEAEKLKEQGNEAFRKKDFPEAIRLYSGAIELDKTCSVYLSNRAAVYLTVNKLDEALADARESVRLDKKNAKGYLRIGKALYALGKYRESMIEGLEPGMALKVDDKTKAEFEECVKRATAALPKDDYKGKSFSYAHGQRHQWPDNRAEEMGIRNGGGGM
jgi:tetratricopeptide (TPR) repeat protein